MLGNRGLKSEVAKHSKGCLLLLLFSCAPKFENNKPAISNLFRGEAREKENENGSG